MMNIETPRYKNNQLNEKWMEAVKWLRTQSKTGWVLDAKQTRKDNK